MGKSGKYRTLYGWSYKILQEVARESLLRPRELLEVGASLFEKEVPKSKWKEWVEKVEPEKRYISIKNVGLYEPQITALFGEGKGNGAVTLWLADKVNKEGDSFIVKLYDEKLRLLGYKGESEKTKPKVETEVSPKTSSSSNFRIKL